MPLILKFVGTTPLQKGTTGDSVKMVQRMLGVTQNGTFGDTTEQKVKEFQQSHKITSNGMVGPQTWDALVDSFLPTLPYPGSPLKQGSTGEIVEAIQFQLSVQQTGTFGPTTEENVSKFQKAYGLPATGVVNEETMQVLFAGHAIVTALAQKAWEIARSQIGVKEQPLGSNAGPQVNAYLKSVGLGPGYFWCAAFVYWCFQQAADQLKVPNTMLRSASSSDLFAWAKQTGRLVTRPQKGDIFLVRGGERTHYHTGMVDDVVDGNGRMPTIEGNSNTDGSANGIEVAHRIPGRRADTCDFVRL